MIRLLLLLVAGIGLAMYYADEIGGADHRDQRTELAPIPTPVAVATKEAPVVLASLGVEPAAPETRTTPRRSKARSNSANMVPFLNPVVVGTDGRIVPIAAEQETTEAPVETEPEEPRIPVRYVSGNRVNVRGGPSTSNEVIGAVEFAEAVQVLSDPTGDWVLIRIEGDGIEGYIFSRFLAESDPQS